VGIGRRRSELAQVAGVSRASGLSPKGPAQDLLAKKGLGRDSQQNRQNSGNQKIPNVITHLYKTKKRRTSPSVSLLG